VEKDGERRGYVAFVRATKRSGSVVVAELVATDDEYALELLDFVRELADGGSIRLRAQPFDVVAALVSAAADREASPQLWLRIVDVAQALSLRRYSAVSSTVLEVRDELLEANRGVFLLETYDDGTVSVSSSSDEAAIVIDVGILSRVFLGGATFLELAASGRDRRQRRFCTRRNRSRIRDDGNAVLLDAPLDPGTSDPLNPGHRIRQMRCGFSARPSGATNGRGRGSPHRERRHSTRFTWCPHPSGTSGAKSTGQHSSDECEPPSVHSIRADLASAVDALSSTVPSVNLPNALLELQAVVPWPRASYLR
jgi:hypothetical protein